MSTGRASGPSRLRRQQRLTARQRKSNGLPHLTLAPLPGYARARPPGCLPDQVGRAAASRAGSGRLPPGGPSGKPPASPWTGHRIDRLLTQAVTSGRNLHSRRSTRDHLINANIMDGGNSIRDCASFPATGLHSAESRDPAWLRRRGGSATSTGSTRAAHEWDTHRLGHERLSPQLRPGARRPQSAPASRLRRRDRHQVTVRRMSAQRERLTARQESVSLTPLRFEPTWENGG
jgi:hypothetical protein